MKFNPRFGLVRVGLVLVMLLFAATACSLGGGDDDEKKDSESVPTVAASITPPGTRTSVPTLTPFPTLTSFNQQPFQPPPTATRLALQPTAVFTPFPTWTPVPATTYPYDVRISYPVDGSQIAGYITVVGSASHPRFLQYALEWGPHPNASNLWYPLTGALTRPVINGALGAWNTTLVSDGQYQIRLHVWLNDGTETFALVTGLRVSNRAPTAVPTLTPTPRPNRPPKIDPILPQQIDAGQTITLDVVTSDRDGDTVNLFVASGNASVATTEVVSRSKINVTGVTAGSSTITVTANDNRGGIASTAFIVTVRGQNRAPTVNPILAQTVDVGQSFTLNIQVSDPDNDALTLSASSSDTAIVTANAEGSDRLIITGVAPGTANITVTAKDGRGGEVNTAFQVTVGTQNQPPIIETIFPQTLSVGETATVQYTATDPDNDTLQASASSDTPNVVTASVTSPGVITLEALAAGPATIELTVTDNVNDPVVATFSVTVLEGNQPPAVDAIGPQTMSVGEVREVNYTATDPDNDTLQADVASDNEQVITAAVSPPDKITLTANAAGAATITLTVSDGVNDAVEVTFTVSVTAANQPPVISAAPGPQTMAPGETREVNYTATDPDNDTLDAMAASDNDAIVQAQVSAPGVITLVANGVGTANVTLTVTDNQNQPVMAAFAVTVEQGNQPPVIEVVPGPQTMAPGETREVNYTATDPDTDPLKGVAASDNDSVAQAQVSAPGVITLVANNPGMATITLTVTDNITAPVGATFTVTVGAANSDPVIQPIGDQTVAVNDTVNVPVVVSDADAGDTLSLVAASDNPGIASAVNNGITEVVVTGVAPGTANVSVEVSDGRGGTASTGFVVTVTGVNNPPVLEPIGDQAITVSEEISVPVVVSDPDGDPVVLTAISADPGIASAEAVGGNSVLLRGVTEGVTTVDLTADDARGGVTTITFTVTVSSAGPGFDLMQYPVIPEIPQPMAQALTNVYQSGKTNFGNQDGVFAKIGDDPMDSQNFLVPFASPGYDLDGRGGIQTMIDFIVTVPVHGDPTLNSLNVNSFAAEAGFGIDSLNAPAPGGSACDQVGGGTNLSCEMQLAKPTIALISFSAPNVTFMSPDQFRSELQSVVSGLLSEYGVIPVLTTIPAGNGYTTEQLTDYNRVIVEVATQTNVTGIPLWNLWRAMQERGITDPNSVAPEGPGNLTDPALNYGYNIRNLTALQTIRTVWQAIGAY